MFPLSSGWFSFPPHQKKIALIANKLTLYSTWFKSNFLLYSFLLLLPSHLLFLYLFRRREAAQVREYIFILVSFYMMINSFWSYTESSRPKLSWVMFNDRLWLCHWYIAPHRVALPKQGATSWVYVQFHHWLISQWYIATDVTQYTTYHLRLCPTWYCLILYLVDRNRRMQWVRLREYMFNYHLWLYRTWCCLMLYRDHRIHRMQWLLRLREYMFSYHLRLCRAWCCYLPVLPVKGCGGHRREYMFNGHLWLSRTRCCSILYLLERVQWTRFREYMSLTLYRTWCCSMLYLPVIVPREYMFNYFTDISHLMLNALPHTC